jgi:hypothetical protein
VSRERAHRRHRGRPGHGDPRRPNRHADHRHEDPPRLPAGLCCSHTTSCLDVPRPCSAWWATSSCAGSAYASCSASLDRPPVDHPPAGLCAGVGPKRCARWALHEQQRACGKKHGADRRPSATKERALHAAILHRRVPAKMIAETTRSLARGSRPATQSLCSCREAERILQPCAFRAIERNFRMMVSALTFLAAAGRVTHANGANAPDVGRIPG